MESFGNQVTGEITSGTDVLLWTRTVWLCHKSALPLTYIPRRKGILPTVAAPVSSDARLEAASLSPVRVELRHVEI